MNRRRPRRRRTKIRNLCGRIESDEPDDVATRRTRPDEEDRTGQCVVALRKQSCSIERVCLDPIDLPEI